MRHESSLYRRYIETHVQQISAKSLGAIKNNEWMDLHKDKFDHAGQPSKTQ